MSNTDKITFVDAVASGFRKATRFSGTSTRPEFWYWWLFTVLIQLVSSTADAFLYPEDLTATFDTNDLTALADTMTTQVQHSLASISTVTTLLLLLPTVAVTVRRFRDAAWKPWLAVASYAALYGGLALSLVFLLSTLPVLVEFGAGTTGDEAASVFTNLGLAYLAVCLQFGALLIIVIGACQPTRRESPAA